MTDDIKELRDILPRVGEPEGTFCCVEGGLLRRLLGRLEAAEKDAAKSECRAILFGDLLHQNIIAMRAAVVAGHLESHAHGLQWIVNSLYGPGHLPNIDEARALGGAQALFDKEMAAHEEFRRTHPGPEAAIDAAMQVRP